jgi:hypothetical protein
MTFKQVDHMSHQSSTAAFLRESLKFSLGVRYRGWGRLMAAKHASFIITQFGILLSLNWVRA